MLVGLMASSAFATNSWVGPSGSWGNGALWGSGLPDGSTLQGDLKICKTNVTSCDLDVAAVSMDNGKLALGGAAGYTIAFNIKTGGSIAIGTEFKVGDSSVGGQGMYGKVVQTGGTVTLNTGTKVGKLEIGYKAGGDGIYTISGGTINGTGTISVGANATSSGGASGAFGKFTVQGSSGSISTTGNLLVGTSDATETYTGTGKLEFKLESGTVSAINAGNVYIDPTATAPSIADLIVSITSGTPTGNILLVNNTGTAAVYGVFDGVSVDGGATYGSAIEGASVVLGGNTYTLTYKGGTGNDIVLVIPEPATIALLSIGLLAIRRNRK